MLKCDHSIEPHGTICDLMLRAFKGVLMSSQSQKVSSALVASNVVAFPMRTLRPSLKLVCTDAAVMRACVHCGGWMAEDESDDDCSSIRLSGAR